MYEFAKQDSFLAKQPKNRKVHRIIVDDGTKVGNLGEGEDTSDKSQSVSLTIQQLRSNLEQTLKKKGVDEKNQINYPDNNEGNTVHEKQKDPNNSIIILRKEDEETIEKAKKIFGEQLNAIVDLVFETKELGNFTEKHKVCSLLISMFSEATRNTNHQDDFANFPAFLVYAKRIFPPKQMQELSTLCGKRINELSELKLSSYQSIKSSTSSTNINLPPVPPRRRKSKSVINLSAISPIKSISNVFDMGNSHSDGEEKSSSPKEPQSPKSDTLHDNTSNNNNNNNAPKPKPKRGGSLKNFFKLEKYTESESSVSRSNDYSLLSATRLNVSRASTEESTPAPTTISPTSPKHIHSALTSPRISNLMKERSFRRVASRPSMQVDDILHPLFENQEKQKQTSWSEIDPIEGVKFPLQLMVRLWDFRYEFGCYPTNELASIFTIEQYWMDEPVYENNFYGKVCFFLLLLFSEIKKFLPFLEKKFKALIIKEHQEM